MLEPHSPDHRSETSAKCPRILVVDDLQDNLDLVTDVLAGESWNVMTASNAQDAWSLMKRWHPDIVLLDVNMPGFDGHNLCTAISLRREFDDVPVVFLTAERTSHEDVERGLKLGAYDYLCKPLDAAELRSRVRTILERHCPQTCRPEPS